MVSYGRKVAIHECGDSCMSMNQRGVISIRGASIGFGIAGSLQVRYLGIGIAVAALGLWLWQMNQRSVSVAFLTGKSLK